ncbi:class I SAM-dependent methyltransferase [Neobacillus sp. MM2021_6]|uniref:class I SAM-dependent methyltransferase n=1 Tax=Bacillaceae TaxID=186817 RepID=UPI001408077D|nr:MULTISPECIES: class I SAM-dependent methyltransferase [Bacillaceae]MBO0962777.1 class I SAM-dependent methyltransferase [Neobacillus sp. MM2021_6]NHC20978.1 class I SAM-dependent methyltransferase [Bacillus sp. MM2020_4]
MTKFKQDMANKGNYGIDAPNVVINLLLIGIILLIVTIFIFRFSGIVWTVLFILLLLGGTVCLLEAIMMVWSSKKGKGYVVKRMIEKLNIKENDLVLDVGCGRGFVLHSLAKQLSNGKVIGIDVWNTKDQSGNNPNVTLQNAEKEGIQERVEIINADARDLPFEANTFDVIASSLAIHNISNKNGRQKAIEEMVRVLKANGHVAILDFQYVEEYSHMFKNAGLKDIMISRLHFSMFPPVRIVTGIKK